MSWFFSLRDGCPSIADQMENLKLCWRTTCWYFDVDLKRFTTTTTTGSFGKGVRNGRRCVGLKRDALGTVALSCSTRALREEIARHIIAITHSISFLALAKAHRLINALASAMTFSPKTPPNLQEGSNRFWSVKTSTWECVCVWEIYIGLVQRTNLINMSLLLDNHPPPTNTHTSQTANRIIKWTG